MTNRKLALVLPTETDIELLAEDAEAARGYAERSLSDATRDAYRSDISGFRDWCEARAVEAVPARRLTRDSLALARTSKVHPRPRRVREGASRSC
jgi:hypothetical protein